MYHCRIHFYLTGRQCRAFEVIREMPPLANFLHEFTESGEPGEDAAGADVILANLQDTDIEEALRVLMAAKAREAELILLVEKDKFSFFTGHLAEINDIWAMPMDAEEARFRFLRWQQSYKTKKDFWQAGQYLDATINHIPNLIWYKDKNGIHEKVNDSFCKTVNKDRKQVEGRGHAYIWDVEEDDPACIGSELEVMKEKRTCVSEEIIKAGNGTRTLMTYKSPLYDLDGSVMGTVGVAIDVTQERAYEQEILRKNHTLETIFTTIDCGVIRHTMDGKRILSVNRAALKILGYETQEEMMADGFWLTAASVLEEDREKLKEDIRTLKKEGDNVSVEYRVRHKTGEIIHVMGTVRLLKENGELLYQRFLLDCTAQKLQEKKNERRQMELIQALSVDYNLVCFFDLGTGKGIPLRNGDENGQEFDANFRGEISLEESMERYIGESVFEDDREMLRRAFSLEGLKKELAEKKNHYINYRAVRDGKVTYFQMKAVRAGEENGVVLGFRSVDEETRREMEQKALLEDALLQANRASKAKSAFLSNMSHDIRTPMNAIVGFTNLAITHIDNKEQVEEYLRKIVTSGNHLLSLINDVLDMSRIESGKIQLEEKPCSLPDILYGLRNILQADINAKQLKLQIDTVDILDEDIYCDKLRLNQVLLNLLSNSVKYTRAGGTVSMRITEIAGAPEGCASYEFVIRDNGIGMSEEFVKHIFEPFEREENSTISGIQGTGLGMAITKNIVDMMGGTIKVESRQGEGSEFTVFFTFRLYTRARESQDISELKNCRALVADDDFNVCDSVSNVQGQVGMRAEWPISEKEAVPCARIKPKAKEEEGGEKTAKLRAGRILLAEDVELNQEIATVILSDAGFCSEVAGNGQIAVDMLKGSEPGYYQLILMDVQMPVMNGYEATKAIRKLENKELASIPIIAMTANAFEEDRQEALKCGMNGHIAKPIDIETLLDTLDKML